jgi:integrase
VWVKADRRRIRRSFPTHAAARSWRASALKAVGDGRLRTPSRVRFRAAADAWLAAADAGTITRRGGTRYKPSVLASYRQSLRKRVYPEIGDYPVERVTTDVLQALVDKWAAAGLSSSSIRNTVTAIRVVTRQAATRKWIPADPVPGLDLPGERGRRERVVDPADVPVMLGALPADDRPVWAVAFMAGLRAGEIRALDWQDVDLAAGVIRVRRSWCDKSRGFVAPKSTAGTRTVPMAGALRDELLEWRARAPAATGLVFGRDAETPRNHSTMIRRARVAWEKAGMAPLGLHEARHSAVSMWVAAGLNATAVSKYAGHSSIAFTLSRYVKLFEGQEREAAAVMDAYLERVNAGR